MKYRISFLLYLPFIAGMAILTNSSSDTAHSDFGMFMSVAAFVGMQGIMLHEEMFGGRKGNKKRIVIEYVDED